MKPASHSLLIFFAGAGVAFAAGFTARRWSSPDDVRKPGPSAIRPNGARPDNSALLTRSWSEALAQTDPVVRSERLIDLLSSADAAAVKRLARRHGDDSELLSLILSRWAEFDPRGAADWLNEGNLDRPLMRPAMGSIIETWASHDPSGLTAWLKETAHVWLQNYHMEKLTGAVFARDPQAAFALAKEFPDTWRLPLRAVEWVRKDAASATRLLGNLPLTSFSAPLLGRAAGLWAEQDPGAAAEWAAQMVKSRGKIGAGALTAVLEKWVERDAVAATAFLKTVTPGLVELNTVYHWAKHDAGAALAWAAANGLPSERGRMISEAVREAAGKDMPAAAAFIAQMPDDGMRDKAQVAFAEAWAVKDPAAAAAWGAQLPPGPARIHALANTASLWAQKDAAAAAAWAKAAPAGSLPGQVYASVMDSLRSNRAAAYGWLNELPESGAYSAISRFCGSSSADVAAVVDLPDGKYKSAVIERTTFLYVSRDPDSAIAWAAALPAGPQRDAVRSALEAAPVVASPVPWNLLTEAKKQEMLKQLQ